MLLIYKTEKGLSLNQPEGRSYSSETLQRIEKPGVLFDWGKGMDLKHGSKRAKRGLAY